MPKILLIGDVHLRNFTSFTPFNRGSNKYNGLTIEAERTIDSLYWVLEEVERLAPDVVVQLGDFWHTRFDVELAIEASKVMFAISQKTKEAFIISGNHDFLDGDRSQIEIFQSWNRVTTPLEIRELNALFLPYTELAIGKGWIENTEMEYVFTHLEFKGFKLNDKKETVGIDAPLEKKIFSGHIHIPQQKKNVVYVGSLRQVAINEIGDTPHGIVFLDTETGKWERLFNPCYPPIVKVKASSVLEGEWEPYTNLGGIRLIVDIDLSPKDLESLKEDLKEIAPLQIQKLSQKPLEALPTFRELSIERIVEQFFLQNPSLRDVAREFGLIGGEK